MIKQNIQALQWFVDFANFDLEKITPGDKAKLLVEAERLWPKEELTQFGSESTPEELASFLGPMKWALDPIPDHQSSEYWETIVTLQGAVKELFSYDFFSGLLSRLSPRQRAAFSKKKPAPLDEAWWHIETIWWVGKRRGSPYSVKMIPIANTQPLCLLLKILKLLDGLPSHVITQCSGCDNLFLNPTLKEKRFCSNRCMWRVNTRNRREANREAYNQYQKELMQARYREEKGHRPIRKKPTAEHVAAEKEKDNAPVKPSRSRRR